MSKSISFLPSATIDVADDGKLTLEIDWSASAQGEYDEATGDLIERTPLTERVCEALDVWLRSLPSWDRFKQKIEIGQLEPEPPTVCDLIEIAADILNQIDDNDQVDTAQQYLSDALTLLAVQNRKGATA